MAPDESFHDLAHHLRSRLADVEDRYTIDQLVRLHADLQVRLAVAEAKLKVAGLEDEAKTLSVVA